MRKVERLYFIKFCSTITHAYTRGYIRTAQTYYNYINTYSPQKIRIFVEEIEVYALPAPIVANLTLLSVPQ